MSRWLKIAGISLIVVVVIAGFLVGWAYRTIAQSVALLDGEIEFSELASAVTIERDALGVPTIRGSNRLDVARGLGFLHAQERFFQMDLMRRQAAGELSEIFGAGALEADRASRMHQFRQRARLVVETMPETEKVLVAAYAEGVNTGLETLREKPFEYVLLRMDPAPWRPEDSVLVLYAMYFVLNDDTGDGESDLGLLEDLLPAELAAFLAPLGTEWDAPIVGEAFETPPIPGVEIPPGEAVAASHDGFQAGELKAVALVGSNNWAVGGSRTDDGRAILANDMHLGMAVPNTWYRAMLEWPAEDGCGSGHRLIGVTLPGSPAVVAGSNTRVAWGFTNSQGDWSDLVILETAPENPNQYLSPDGWLTIENHTETILVRDGEPESIEVRTTNGARSSIRITSAESEPFAGSPTTRVAPIWRCSDSSMLQRSTRLSMLPTAPESRHRILCARMQTEVLAGRSSAGSRAVSGIRGGCQRRGPTAPAAGTVGWIPRTIRG